MGSKKRMTAADLAFLEGTDRPQESEGQKLHEAAPTGYLVPLDVAKAIVKLKAKGWDGEDICQAMTTLALLVAIEQTHQIEHLKHLAFDHDNLNAARMLRDLIKLHLDAHPTLLRLQADAESEPFVFDTTTDNDEALKATERLIEKLEAAAKGDTLH